VPVVVFDDGSQDGSQEAVAPLVSAYVRSENRGITVNKNRALFYFCRIRPAKRVLILEDDLLVTESGWLKAWKRAIDHHGHINLALPQWSKDAPEFHGGRGTPRHPKRWTRVSGCAMGARIRLVKRSIGYLNPRFAGYGYEHAEWTERWIAAGYGGAITPRGRVYFALSQGLTLQPAPSSAAPEQIASNLEVFLSLREAGYPRARRPWLSPGARRDFLEPFRPLTPGEAKHGR
jgi:glycosyltransferase involved in cell wall biosynthesis